MQCIEHVQTMYMGPVGDQFLHRFIRLGVYAINDFKVIFLQRSLSALGLKTCTMFFMQVAKMVLAGGSMMIQHDLTWSK